MSTNASGRVGFSIAERSKRASNELSERVERLQVARASSVERRARRGTSADPSTTVLSLVQVPPSDTTTAEARAGENAQFAAKPPASPPTLPNSFGSKRYPDRSSIFDAPHSEQYKPLGSLSARRTQSTRGTAYNPQPTVRSRSFPSTAGKDDERSDVMKQLQEVTASHDEVWVGLGRIVALSYRSSTSYRVY